MNTLTTQPQIILQTGLALLLQSTLLLALGLLASWLLRRRGPALRAFALQMTLAGVALGCALSVGLAGRVHPMWALSLPSAVKPASPQTFPAPAVIPADATAPAIGPEVSHLAAPSVPASVPPPSPPTPTVPPTVPAAFVPYWPMLVVGVWLGGTLALLLWLGVCQAHLARLMRRATPITQPRATEMLARLSEAARVRPPRLAHSPAVRSPFLAGLTRPTIFLPSGWDTDEATLQAVLAHELAHLHRRDLWWTLLLRLTTALLWPQPLLWLLGHQLERATEEACDLLAVTPDLPARRYADCLLRLAERAGPTYIERAIGAGVTPVKSALGFRIQNILQRRNLVMHTLSPRLRVVAALVAAVLALCAAVFVSVAAAPASDSQRAVAIVQQYLDARASGEADVAYQLLSSQTRQVTPQDQFTRGEDFTGHLARDPSPAYTAVNAFFSDPHNTLGATYTVTGPDPNAPDTVDVSAQIPSISALVTLHVHVVADPGSDGELKIDADDTFQQTDATAYTYLQAKDAQMVTQDHLRRIALAILQYTQDHDEVLPDANRWMDEIAPYLTSGPGTPAHRQMALATVMHDPSAPAGQKWCYAYNRLLSHLPLARTNAVAQIVEVFPTTLNIKNASDTGQSVPQPGWVGGANFYAFVDGHVKSLRSPLGPIYSFQPTFNGTASVRDEALSNIVSLQHSLEQEQQNLMVDEKAAETYTRLAARMGQDRNIPTMLNTNSQTSRQKATIWNVASDPNLRPLARNLEAKILNEKAQIEVMAQRYAPNNPKLIRARETLQAHEDQLKELLKRPYLFVERNDDAMPNVAPKASREYQQLRQGADRARAQATCDQALIASIKDQIHRQKATMTHQE